MMFTNPFATALPQNMAAAKAPPSSALAPDERKKMMLANMLQANAAQPTNGATPFGGMAGALSQGINGGLMGKMMAPTNSMHSPNAWIPTVTPAQ